MKQIEADFNRLAERYQSQVIALQPEVERLAEKDKQLLEAVLAEPIRRTQDIHGRRMRKVRELGEFVQTEFARYGIEDDEEAAQKSQILTASANYTIPKKSLVEILSEQRPEPFSPIDSKLLEEIGESQEVNGSEPRPLLKSLNDHQVCAIVSRAASAITAADSILVFPHLDGVSQTFLCYSS